MCSECVSLPFLVTVGIEGVGHAEDSVMVVVLTRGTDGQDVDAVQGCDLVAVTVDVKMDVEGEHAVFELVCKGQEE